MGSCAPLPIHGGCTHHSHSPPARDGEQAQPGRHSSKQLALMLQIVDVKKTTEAKKQSQIKDIKET